MWNKLRELVSGKKVRYKENGYNLDLTYICPRIIGMSFPASGLESAYRNHIDEVANLLNDKHPNSYLVFNLSGRPYDFARFNNNVKTIMWEDHHSPPIHTLFQCCEEMHRYLKESPTNVIVVHCLAGKGRTGTVICCYLMYCGRIKTPEDALQYYSQRRFSTKGLGVTQPSQVRYIHYFYQLLKNPFLSPTLTFIEGIRLFGVPKYNSGGSCKPYIDITSMKDLRKVYTGKKSHAEQASFMERESGEQERPGIGFLNMFEIKMDKIVPIYGDVLIKMKNNGSFRNKLMFRFAFNTAFLPKDGVLTMYLDDLDPDSVKENKLFPQNFIIEMKFQNNNCKCTNETMFEDKCSACMMDLEGEKENWDKIYDIMRDYTAFKDPKAFEESKFLLFGYPELDDIEKTLNAPVNKEPFEKIDDFDSNSDSDKDNEDKKKKSSIKKEDLAYYMANDASAFMGEPSRFTIRGISEEEKKE